MKYKIETAGSAEIMEKYNVREREIEYRIYESCWGEEE